MKMLSAIESFSQESYWVSEVTGQIYSGINYKDHLPIQGLWVVYQILFVSLMEGRQST